MSDTSARRPRPRAFWADTRFLLGILLVVLSVAGVWFVVSAARESTPVFAASRTLVPGEVVTSDDLTVVDVALGGAVDAYATPATWQAGMITTRTIVARELVPASAVASATQSRTTTVVVRSATAIPDAVRTGVRVELWAAAQRERGVFDPPEVLVSDATVVSVDRDSSIVASAGTSVELVIGRADVAATLAALADGSSLSIVPLAGPAAVTP